MHSWILDTVSSMGTWGVALLMFLENVCPPIPSELIMPLAGYLTVSGSMKLWPVIAAGGIGSLAGATFWYCVARRWSNERFRGFVERHGVWLAMDLEDLDRAQDWFTRHGRKAVFLGRMIPGIRTLISVPAGLSRMPPGSFLLWSAAGTALWTGTLAWGGRILGSRFRQIDAWIGPIAWIVLGGMILWYVTGVVRKLRNRSPGVGSTGPWARTQERGTENRPPSTLQPRPRIVAPPSPRAWLVAPELTTPATIISCNRFERHRAGRSASLRAVVCFSP